MRDARETPRPVAGPDPDPGEAGTAAPTRSEVRVRYAETDRMGVVYHANYLVWFEIGRTDLMRDLGHAYGALEDRDGILFPVIEASVRYLRSARYDERIAVETRVERVRGARVRFGYRALRLDDGTLLAEGRTEHAAIGRDGRPRRLPARLRAALETRRT